MIIHCPRAGCTHAASATTEGKAIQAIVSHIVKAHNPPPCFTPVERLAEKLIQSAEVRS